MVRRQRHLAAAGLGSEKLARHAQDPEDTSDRRLRMPGGWRLSVHTRVDTSLDTCWRYTKSPLFVTSAHEVWARDSTTRGNERGGRGEGEGRERGEERGGEKEGRGDGRGEGSCGKPAACRKNARTGAVAGAPSPCLARR